MIVFGTKEALQQCHNTNIWWHKLVNFNTLVESVEQLMYLNPYRGRYNGTTDSLEFDAWYINYLSSNPPAFREFINIMREAYNGHNVWILCDFSAETAINVIEILIKYIMESYGYACNVVHNPDDTDNLIEGSFSPLGIQMFDAHMENYLQYFGDRGLYTDPE